LSLFPPNFVDDLKSHADIVQIIQERVPLRRSGATWKGLCPFHGEKTPSFHVNGDKGVFHCFGCGVGGDVIEFVKLHDKITFPEAVRQLAARVGLPVPEPEESNEDAQGRRDRETLLKAHEIAASWFREQLSGASGGAARRLLVNRGLTQATVELLGVGYAPASWEGLKTKLLNEGFEPSTLMQTGLFVEREGQQIRDRFRNRLMFPIARDNGAIIAFGGRAMEEGQNPKYLNSPETPIYVKGRTLYGLHLSKPAIAKAKHAVMVEGYFDVAQAIQGGIPNVVASSGTALTPWQARLLKRFATKVVLSFDPDAAGQGAAARSSELLVAEGFQVNVAMMPTGDDPDTLIRREGGAAYAERLRGSRPYLEYLLDRAAIGQDLSRDEQRREFLGKMLEVAARIPDAAARDQFADRLAHKARVTEEVVRAEIRKAAAKRETTVPALNRPKVAMDQVRTAEKGLIWALLRDASNGLRALLDVETQDLEGLATRQILEQARSLQEWPAAALPEALLERLTTVEAALVQEIGRQPHPPGPPLDCVQALKRLRYTRERADVQREIDRLQEEGGANHESEILALWARKKVLLQRIESLIDPEAGDYNTPELSAHSPGGLGRKKH
jgi:DNA primase